MDDSGENIKKLNSDEEKVKEKLMDYIAKKNYPINQVKGLIIEDIQEIVWEDVKDDIE